MKIAVGLLTYNMFSTGRDKMFEDSLKVLREEFGDVLIYTYGSTDGTGQRVEELGGIWNRTIDAKMATRYSAGYKELGDLLYKTGADIIFVTADDIVYRPGIAEAMVNWWTNAPRSVAITSWILEPSYPWNALLDKLECAGIKGYSRATAPGCSWSFHRKDWNIIKKRPLFEDIGICTDFVKDKRPVVQVDWGDHVGEKTSAWGNESWKNAVPFDPETAHVHRWEHIGLILSNGEMAFSCHEKDCAWGAITDRSGAIKGYDINMFPMTAGDKKMDIQDSPHGTVSKMSWKEVYDTYDLDKLGDEIWDDCVFVDIGANVGVISTWVAMTHPDVVIYAYEPDKVNYDLLCRNLRVNAPNVHAYPINKAVTGDGRDVYVIGARTNPGGITIYANNSPYDPGASVMGAVESTTLSEIIAMLPPHRHLILKIDTEGAEHEILAPPVDELVAEKADVLCIEYHDVAANKWKAHDLAMRMMELMGVGRIHWPSKGVYLRENSMA